MFVFLLASLVSILCAPQGASGLESPPIITNVLATSSQVIITASNTKNSLYKVLLFRHNAGTSSGLEQLRNSYSVSFPSGVVSLQRELNPFILYAIKIAKISRSGTMLASNFSNAFDFTLSASATLKAVTDTSATIEFPERGTSLIQGFIVSIFKEDYEGFPQAEDRRSLLYTRKREFANLQEGTTYLLRVRPWLSRPEGNRLQVREQDILVQTHPTKPGEPPQNISVNQTSPSSIQLTWASPTPELRNGRLTHFVIRWRGAVEDKGSTEPETFVFNISSSSSSSSSLSPLSPSSSNNASQSTGSSHQLSHHLHNGWSYTISGLDNGTEYLIEVAAGNVAGIGDFGSITAYTDQPGANMTTLPPSETTSVVAPVGDEFNGFSWLIIVVPVGVMLFVLVVTAALLIFCCCKVWKMSTPDALTVSMSQTQNGLEDANMYVGPNTHVYEDPEVCLQEYKLGTMVRKLAEAEAEEKSRAGHAARLSHTLPARQPPSAAPSLPAVERGRTVRCTVAESSSGGGGGYATLEVGSRNDYASNTDLRAEVLTEPAEYERPWNDSEKSHYEYQREAHSSGGSAVVEQTALPVLVDRECEVAPGIFVASKHETRDSGTYSPNSAECSPDKIEEPVASCP